MNQEHKMNKTEHNDHSLDQFLPIVIDQWMRSIIDHIEAIMSLRSILDIHPSKRLIDNKDMEFINDYQSMLLIQSTKLSTLIMNLLSQEASSTEKAYWKKNGRIRESFSIFGKA